MNKKLFIAITLIAYIFTFQNTAHAKSEENFRVSAVNDDRYTIELGFGDKVGTFDNPAAIAEKPLKSYFIFYLSGLRFTSPISLEYQWNDPEYIIQEGYQTVLINAKSFLDEFTIEVTVNGITPEQYEEQLIKELGISLTKEKLSLNTKSTYDINIKNKVKDSTYVWTTSNKKVAKINKYGVVTGVKKGKAVITCTITTPNGDILKLKCNVTIK